MVAPAIPDCTSGATKLLIDPADKAGEPLKIPAIFSGAFQQIMP
jgi:hypothetical protein